MSIHILEKDMNSCNKKKSAFGQCTFTYHEYEIHLHRALKSSLGRHAVCQSENKGTSLRQITCGTAVVLLALIRDDDEL